MNNLALPRDQQKGEVMECLEYGRMILIYKTHFSNDLNFNDFNENLVKN